MGWSYQIFKLQNNNLHIDIIYIYIFINFIINDLDDREFIYHVFFDIQNDASESLSLIWEITSSQQADLLLCDSVRKVKTIKSRKKQRVCIALKSRKQIEGTDLKRYIKFYNLGNDGTVKKRIHAYSSSINISPVDSRSFFF